MVFDSPRAYSQRIRVNALAPGFFLTDQNRYLLVDAHCYLDQLGRLFFVEDALVVFAQHLFREQ